MSKRVDVHGHHGGGACFGSLFSRNFTIITLFEKLIRGRFIIMSVPRCELGENTCVALVSQSNSDILNPILPFDKLGH